MKPKIWVNPILFVIVVLVLVALMLSGCGVHAELTYNPETGVWDVYYHNTRALTPENITVTLPDGATLVIGEQATQNAVIGALTDRVILLSGVGK